MQYVYYIAFPFIDLPVFKGYSSRSVKSESKFKAVWTAHYFEEAIYFFCVNISNDVQGCLDWDMHTCHKATSRDCFL